MAPSTLEIRKSVADKQAAVAKSLQRDGARLPPPGGRIRVWSAGSKSVDEHLSKPGAQERHGQKDPLAEQAGVLEAYSSILDGARDMGDAVPHGRRAKEVTEPQERGLSQGARPGPNPAPVSRADRRESIGAQVTGLNAKGETKLPRERLLEQAPAAESRGRPSTSVWEDGPAAATADARSQAGPRGGAERPLENNTKAEAAQAGRTAGAQGPTREGDRNGAGGSAEAPSRNDATQGPAQAAWSQSRRLQGSLASTSGAALAAERVGAGQSAGSRPADPLGGATAAHAAALQWWREVVEAHADPADDATEEAEQEDDGVGAALSDESAAGSVSSRARAILVRCHGTGQRRQRQRPEARRNGPLARCMKPPFNRVRT